MTNNNESVLTVDDLCGCTDSEVKAAQKFIESCSSVTSSLTAIVATLRGAGQVDMAVTLERILIDMAETEIESM